MTGMQLDGDVQQELMDDESLTSEEQLDQNVLVNDSEANKYPADLDGSDDDSESGEDSEQSESEDEIDLAEGLSDSEHESESSESDLEDNGPNLFACTAITFKDNATLVKDVSSTTECKKTFSNRPECIKHIKTCPASMSHPALVRSDPTVRDTVEEGCDYCPKTFLLATSLQMYIEAHHAEQEYTYSHKDC